MVLCKGARPVVVAKLNRRRPTWTGVHWDVVKHKVLRVNLRNGLLGDLVKVRH